jgi:hypothetical protein
LSTDRRDVLQRSPVEDSSKPSTVERGAYLEAPPVAPRRSAIRAEVRVMSADRIGRTELDRSRCLGTDPETLSSIGQVCIEIST